MKSFVLKSLREKKNFYLDTKHGENMEVVLLAIFIGLFLVALSLKIGCQKKEKSKKSTPKRDFEVLITSYDEEEEILRKTILSWKNLGKPIWLVRVKSLSNDFQEFLEENGVKLIFQTKDVKGKAGAINLYLSKATKEWFFIVDGDEELASEENVKALLEEEGKLIVGKKEFKEKSFFGKVMNSTNNIFYIVQCFLSEKGRALFNGSAALINTKIAKRIKFKNKVVEDIDFSLNLIEKGEKIRFVDRLICRGKEPTLMGFINQHLKYSYGNGEVVRDRVNKLLKMGKIAVVLVFLPLLSATQSLLIIVSLTNPLIMVYEALLSYIIYVLYLGERSLKLFLATFVLNFIVMPFPRTIFFLMGLLGIRYSFKTTSSFKN